MNTAKTALVGLAICVLGVVALPVINTVAPAYINVAGAILLLGFVVTMVSLLAGLWELENDR